jgi:uncharacterized protein YjbI with pentapeptide repeats
MSTIRLGYENSCQLLQELGYLDSRSIPPLPPQQPSINDPEPLGVGFFRTLVAEDALENLSLPRTFFGRSEVRCVSFKNTLLSESNLCWNDFIEVDFTKADLSRSDLRASMFKTVKFVEANLRHSDLRHSTFEECDFTDAELDGVKLTHEQGDQLTLSNAQRESVSWCSDAGSFPDGG